MKSLLLPLRSYFTSLNLKKAVCSLTLGLTLMPSMLGFATNFDPIITGTFSQQEPPDAYAPLSFKRVRNRPPMKPVTGD